MKRVFIDMDNVLVATTIHTSSNQAAEFSCSYCLSSFLILFVSYRINAYLCARL